MSEPIPFIDLKAQYARLKPEIDAAIARVLAHGQFILGPEVAEFEAALAAHAGVGYAVSCASGTDALTIALMAEGIGPGDAVFLPAFTFTATPEAVALLGARPVFVDVDESSYLIDSTALEAAIDECRTEGAAFPRAVIAVDLFGQPADYDGHRPNCRRARTCGHLRCGPELGRGEGWPPGGFPGAGHGGQLLPDQTARLLWRRRRAVDR